MTKRFFFEIIFMYLCTSDWLWVYTVYAISPLNTLSAELKSVYCNNYICVRIVGIKALQHDDKNNTGINITNTTIFYEQIKYINLEMLAIEFFF